MGRRQRLRLCNGNLLVAGLAGAGTGAGEQLTQHGQCLRERRSVGIGKARQPVRDRRLRSIPGRFQRRLPPAPSAAVPRGADPAGRDFAFNPPVRHKTAHDSGHRWERRAQLVLPARKGASQDSAAIARVFGIALPIALGPPLRICRRTNHTRRQGIEQGGRALVGEATLLIVGDNSCMT